MVADIARKRGMGGGVLVMDGVVDFLQMQFKKQVCQESWMKQTLIVQCETCGLSPDSCICFACFMAGDHEGHVVTVRHGSSGNCDCGDPVLWSPDGWCHHHKGTGKNPEQDELTLEEREAFRSIFSICLEQLAIFAGDFNPSNFISILNLMTKLVSIGDAIRRCCALSVDRIKLYQLIETCIEDESDLKRISLLVEFMGKMINDPVFHRHCAHAMIPNYPKLVRRMITGGSGVRENASMAFDFVFHIFHAETVGMVKAGLNWSKIALKTLNLFLLPIVSRRLDFFEHKAKVSRATGHVFDLLMMQFARCPAMWSFQISSPAS
jgi:hypothetical protein